MKPSAAEHRPTLLSIDFDFFPWLPEEPAASWPEWSKDSPLAPRSISRWWGSEPRFSAEGQQSYWDYVSRRAAEHGVDLAVLCAVHKDLGCIEPETLIRRLAWQLKPGTPLYLAVNHDDGTQPLEDLGPVDVISFDAHHDLSYYEEGGQIFCDCGSWLGYALEQGLTERVRVVYPRWRGKLEWDDPETEPRNAVLERFDARAGVYPELGGLAEAEIAGVLLCLSPGWTPPTLYPAFQRCVRILREHGCEEQWRAHDLDEYLAIKLERELVQA